MNIREKNKARKLHLDEKALALADEMIETDLVRGKLLTLLEDLKRFYAERGFLTEPQRKLIRKIKKDYEDFEYERELMQTLADYYNADKTDPNSGEFITSVIDFFNEQHRITKLQREQVIEIVDKISRQSNDD